MVVTGFNNSNQLDVLIANDGTNNVLVLIDYLYKQFARQTNYFIGTGAVVSSAVVYDFNNDSRLDIVVNGFDDGNIVILIGLGNENFSDGTAYSIGARSGPYTAVTSDFNNDNISDIAIANSGT